MQSKPPKIERPCKSYEKDGSCDDGRDHCFNCGRHLIPETAQCPKGCKDQT
jgi:hypothetical protein